MADSPPMISVEFCQLWTAYRLETLRKSSFRACIQRCIDAINLELVFRATRFIVPDNNLD